MNEFVEQFLIEGRELVDAGQRRPAGPRGASRTTRERLDGAFRAFHTLKGAAGIVDFVAMGRALHAAEDGSPARALGRRSGDAAADRSLPGLPGPGQRLDRPDVRSPAKSPPTPMPRRTISIRRFSSLGAADESAILPQRAAGPRDAASAGLSAIARQILEAQKLLLAEPAAEGAAGRLESAGRVSANVLRHHGRSLDANDLEGCCRPACSPATPHRWRRRSTGCSRGLTERPPAPPGTLPPSRPTPRCVSTSSGSIALVRLTGELLIAKNAIGHSAAASRRTPPIPRQLAAGAQEPASAARAAGRRTAARRCSACASCRSITPSSAFRASCARWRPPSASRHG